MGTMVGPVQVESDESCGVRGANEGESEEGSVEGAASLFIGVIIGGVCSGIVGVPCREQGREGGNMPGMCWSGPNDATEGEDRFRGP